MPDRLRELIDLVLSTRWTTRPRTAPRWPRRAHFSRDHLDRLVAAATGESPVALRRRLLLERAAWQLRTGRGNAERGRHRRRATARSPRSAARSRAPTGRRRASSSARRSSKAPNGIHFHPPALVLIPSHAAPRRDLTERDGRSPPGPDPRAAGDRRPRSRPPSWSARCVRDLTVVWFEGEEPSAALMAERLVWTLEVWVAAISGEPVPERAGELLARLDRAARAFSRIAKAIRDRRRVGRRVRRRPVRAARDLHLRRRAVARALPTAPCGARRWPACCASSAPRCPGPATRSSGNAPTRCGSLKFLERAADNSVYEPPQGGSTRLIAGGYDRSRFDHHDGRPHRRARAVHHATRDRVALVRVQRDRLAILEVDQQLSPRARGRTRPRRRACASGNRLR